MHTIAGVSENDKKYCKSPINPPPPLSDTPSRFLRKKVIAPLPNPLSYEA